MAIQAHHKDPTSGARVPNAYVAVKQILCRYDGGLPAGESIVEVHLSAWSSAAAKAKGLAPFSNFGLATSTAALSKFVRAKDGADLRLAVYRWLKKRKPAEGEIDFRKAKDLN